MPKYKKGSTEMKNYMAKLRSMKGTTKTKKMKGEGILGDAWDYIKKGASYVKDNKLISKALSAGAVLAPEFAPILGTSSSIASAIGLGKKKNKKKMMMM
jgi:hypothetical protein